MPEEIIETIEAEEFKTPQIKTALQAFSLIFTGLSFFLTNYKLKTILFLVILFVVALVTYNNINLVTDVYKMFVK